MKTTFDSSVTIHTHTPYKHALHDNHCLQHLTRWSRFVSQIIAETARLFSGQSLAGIEFGDNKAQQFLTEDNGYASISFRVISLSLSPANHQMLIFLQVSQQLTFCTWLYPRWSRWNVILRFWRHHQWLNASFCFSLSGWESSSSGLRAFCQLTPTS